MILPAPSEPSSASPSSSKPVPLKLIRGSRVSHGHSPTSISHEIPPIQTLNSAFQMAEYLALLIKDNPHDVDRLVELPSYYLDVAKEGGADKELKKETDLWIYEHLRRLPQDLTPLTTSLFPICNRQTCPDMRAGEWQYICVAHPQTANTPECCAIDYIVHTLDSTTALLVSTSTFPSRLSIKPGSEKLFGQLARRISRIFSHAYFHHRDVFEESEAETSLYARFLGLSKKYGLVSSDLLVIPSPSPPTSPSSPSNSHFSPPTPSSTISAVSPIHDTHAIPSSKPAPLAADDDDDEFSRELPGTSRKIEGAERTFGRGSRGGRGKGRGRLFEVEVAKDEDADEDDEGGENGAEGGMEAGDGEGLMGKAQEDVKVPNGHEGVVPEPTVVTEEEVAESREDEEDTFESQVGEEKKESPEGEGKGKVGGEKKV